MTRHAIDLDQPAIQHSVLRYLAVMAETLARTANAIETGNPGRERAREELATLALLVHYLSRRLGEAVSTEEGD